MADGQRDRPNARGVSQDVLALATADELALIGMAEPHILPHKHVPRQAKGYTDISKRQECVINRWRRKTALMRRLGIPNGQ